MVPALHHLPRWSREGLKLLLPLAPGPQPSPLQVGWMDREMKGQMRIHKAELRVKNRVALPQSVKNGDTDSPA